MRSVVNPVALAVPATLGVAAPALSQRNAKGELPIKYTGKPTTPEITAADLMTRLYIFADDSMMGREVGTKYNLMGTAYIEREVRRMGLVPAGDNGGYFQNLPLYTTVIDSSSSLSVAGQVLDVPGDYLPLTRDERRLDFTGVPVVFAGTANDSTTWVSDLAGKVAVVNIPAPGIIIPNLPTLRANLAKANAV